jgi:hypothetical protein
VVDAFVTLRPAASNLNLYVKTLLGKTLSFKVRPEESVGDLKARIQDKEGIPPDQQRLFAVGRVGVREELEDGRVLRDCDLCNEAVLHMVKRLGGASSRSPPAVSPHMPVPADDEVVLTVRLPDQREETIVVKLASTVASLLRLVSIRAAGRQLEEPPQSQTEHQQPRTSTSTTHQHQQPRPHAPAAEPAGSSARGEAETEHDQVSTASDACARGAHAAQRLRSWSTPGPSRARGGVWAGCRVVSTRPTYRQAPRVCELSFGGNINASAKRLRQ